MCPLLQLYVALIVGSLGYILVYSRVFLLAVLTDLLP